MQFNYSAWLMFSETHLRSWEKSRSCRRHERPFANRLKLNPRRLVIIFSDQFPINSQTVHLPPPNCFQYKRYNHCTASKKKHHSCLILNHEQTIRLFLFKRTFLLLAAVRLDDSAKILLSEKSPKIEKIFGWVKSWSNFDVWKVPLHCDGFLTKSANLWLWL